MEGTGRNDGEVSGATNPEGGAADEAGAGGVGDVEAAGETTAASAITGPDDTRPVGTGTRVEVEGDPKRS